MNALNAAFPFSISAGGRTTLAAHVPHVRQMIEQVLLTSPGERVNRPNFGCELKRLTFSNTGDEILMAAEAMIQSALSQWLGELVAVKSVSVTAGKPDGRINVIVEYTLIKTGERDRTLVVLKG